MLASFIFVAKNSKTGGKYMVRFVLPFWSALVLDHSHVTRCVHCLLKVPLLEPGTPLEQQWHDEAEKAHEMYGSLLLNT